MSLPERLLLGPGPSNAYPEVLAALGQPLLGHLDPEFLRILDETSDRLRTAFRTTNALTLPISGTGSAGMEACFVNLVEPGDTVIVGVNGVFGERMCEVARRCGAEVIRVEAAWGEPIDPQALLDALAAAPHARLVAVVHAETSTGVRSDIAPLRALQDTDTLLLVDTVTGLAGIPVEIDAWGVDACYSGTQKCLGVPPGLAPVTFSDRALERIRTRTTPPQSWYLDLGLIGDYVGAARKYHHTAPVAMVVALHAGLGVLLDEGLETGGATRGQDGIHPIRPEPLHPGRRLGRQPRLVRRDPRLDVGPIGFGEAGAASAEQGLDGGGAEPGKRGRPRRVHSFGQGKRPAGLDPRQRKPGDFLARDPQVAGREREILGFGSIEGGQGAAIEGRQPAADEIVVDLRPHGRDRRGGGARRRSGRSGFTGPGVPGRKGRQLSVESRALLARDTRRAAAVRRAAETGDDVADQLPGLLILGRFRRDHAVAVERISGQELRRITRLGHRDRPGVRSPKSRKDLAGAVGDGPALRGVGIEG